MISLYSYLESIEVVHSDIIALAFLDKQLINDSVGCHAHTHSLDRILQQILLLLLQEFKRDALVQSGHHFKKLLTVELQEFIKHVIICYKVYYVIDMYPVFLIS